MVNSPFTIQTFFPTGDTRSYRISQIPTRTIQALLIPREELFPAIERRSELEYNGIYFLFEEEGYLEANGDTLVYIGESENIANRLKDHETKKANWKIAIVFTTNSKDNQLTKSDLKYLENYCYQKAAEVGRYILKQNTPTKSFVNESREADLFDIYQTISELLSFSGYPIFIPLQTKEDRQEQPIFYMTARKSDAKALYSKDGMTVLKGSKVSPSFETTGFRKQNLLKQLIKTEVLSDQGVFQKDYTFSSPSGAADFIGKASYNGWEAWKTKEGLSLDKVIGRKEGKSF